VTRVEESKNKAHEEISVPKILRSFARPSWRSEEDIWVVLIDANRKYWSFGKGEM